MGEISIFKNLFDHRKTFFILIKHHGLSALVNRVVKKTCFIQTENFSVTYLKKDRIEV